MLCKCLVQTLCVMYRKSILSFVLPINPKKPGRGALCYEWGFTRTFPGNQDVAMKQKSEVIYVIFW